MGNFLIFPSALQLAHFHLLPCIQVWRPSHTVLLKTCQMCQFCLQRSHCNFSLDSNFQKVVTRTSEESRQRGGRFIDPEYLCFKWKAFQHSKEVFASTYPSTKSGNCNWGLKRQYGGFPVAQWIGIYLPVQVTWVRSLVEEDSTCRGASKPINCNCWAHMPHWLKPTCLKPLPWEAYALQWRVAPAHCN